MNNEQNAKLVELNTLSHLVQPKATEAQVSSAETSTDVNDEDGLLCTVMARVANRDERALGDLYDISSSRLFAIACRVTGNTAAAEEIVSEVFTQVWQGEERYDPDRGRVIVWLLTICRSRALEWRRRYAETAQPEGDAAAWIDLYKTGTTVRTALEMLNERERYLVGLAFFRGLTHQEITEHTGIPVDTVKTVMGHALSLLRERLHHQGVVEEPR